MVNNRYSQHYVDKIRNGPAATLAQPASGEILCENVCNALLERLCVTSNFVMMYNFESIGYLKDGAIHHLRT